MQTHTDRSQKLALTKQLIPIKMPEYVEGLLPVTLRTACHCSQKQHDQRQAHQAVWIGWRKHLK